jgi:hypothetical protein
MGDARKSTKALDDSGRLFPDDEERREKPDYGKCGNASPYVPI